MSSRRTTSSMPARTRAWDLIAYSYALYPGWTDYDLYGSNWDIRINPQGWNPGGYDDELVDGLIRQVLVSPNLNSQGILLDQLQQQVNENLFALWFGFPSEPRAGSDCHSGIPAE